MTIKQLSEARKLAPEALTGKRWKIKIIEGDRQGSSAYYPKEALESGKDLFGPGVRIFKNHPSESDRWEQPERRIEDIIGWVTETATYDGKDLYTEVEFLESEQARIKQLAEAGVIAMSIRASGEMVETANGMELKRFTAVHSVDVVTQAGAGGAFINALESDRTPNNSEANAEENEEDEEVEFPKELAEALDKQAQLTNDLLERLIAKEDAEKTAVEEAQRKQEAEESKGPSASEIAGALREAGLSPKAEAHVLKLVENGADLKESIDAQKELAADILESAGANGGGFIEESKQLSESERNEKLIGLTFGR